MAWYVFAFVDAVPAGTAGEGLTGALSLRKLAGAFVVVERRADVPPVAFGTLKRHHDVVAHLAALVPAILPVRFGTLLTTPDLEDAVEDRDEEIAEAFGLVRDRVQFTWRMTGRTPQTGGRRLKAEHPWRDRAADRPKSGAAYLRRAAQAANPAPPAAFRVLQTGLSSLIASQRYQQGTPGLPEAVYHLVDRRQLDRYVAAAAGLKESRTPFTLSGPFPPFAFAPEIL
jgi:Gas vesicle synthesis protein GvpL/GvpF